MSVIVMGLAAIVAPAPAPAATPQADIEAAMTASAAGWNAGDLDRFMAVYAPDAIYAAGGKLTRGKPAIAALYQKSFATGGNTRGKLTFQPMAWRTISNVHHLLVARWTLTPAAGAGKVETGLTTLLFERRKEGWRIISDHSS